MGVIVSPSNGAYFSPMPAVIIRLLALLALIMMPFGMGAAMAAPVHHAPSSAAAEHCGEHGSQPDKKSPSQAADCAIACSMLMTAETGLAEPPPALRLPAARAPADHGHGLHPDTATPPPKPS